MNPNNMQMNNKILNIKCPQCRAAFNYYSSDFRPFCSERCRKIDLGHWFQESYVVPLKEAVNESLADDFKEETDDSNTYENEYH